MRSLFKNVANELIQQMTPEDLKEIMDNTVVTVLEKMGPEERLEFSKEIVNNAVDRILSGFDETQRHELVRALLPVLLTKIGLDLRNSDDEQIANALRKMREG